MTITASCRPFAAALPVVLASCFLACARPQATSHTAAIFDKAGHRLPDSSADTPDVNWVVLGPSVPNYLHWNGVGSISPGCTATLLDQRPGTEGPVYLITAGHCLLEGTDPNTILADQSAESRVRLGPYIQRGPDTPRPLSLTADHLAYATMKNTDVAIFSVSGTTRAHLRDSGVQALALATSAPTTGEALVMPHVPAEGVSVRGLHLSTCTAGATVDLEENGAHSLGAFRNHCSAVGGTSGAPVLSVASGKIVGLLTTGTRDLTDGLPDCSDSRPCEIAADGSKHTYGEENYAQHVSQMAACFDEHGVFSLDAAGCGLEKPQM